MFVISITFIVLVISCCTLPLIIKVLLILKVILSYVSVYLLSHLLDVKQAVNHYTCKYWHYWEGMVKYMFYLFYIMDLNEEELCLYLHWGKYCHTFLFIYPCFIFSFKVSVLSVMDFEVYTFVFFIKIKTRFFLIISFRGFFKLLSSCKSVNPLHYYYLKYPGSIHKKSLISVSNCNACFSMLFIYCKCQFCCQIQLHHCFSLSLLIETSCDKLLIGNAIRNGH